MNDWSQEVKKQEKSVRECRNFKIEGTNFVSLFIYHKVLGTRAFKKYKTQNDNTGFISLLDCCNGFLNGLLAFIHCFF